ncbi:hypothetical protein, partial [Agriterribacter sp.]|uniref:hypothetical protein n=1 Tax=Agriterribacter sp. TaxID=2821509 RepID=UPI002BC37AF9
EKLKATPKESKFQNGEEGYAEVPENTTEQTHLIKQGFTALVCVLTYRFLSILKLYPGYYSKIQNHQCPFRNISLMNNSI